MCLIWKSYDISFTEAIKELKLIFKVVDNVLSDKDVQNFIKYEYKPKEVQSLLTKNIVYELETYN